MIQKSVMNDNDEYDKVIDNREFKINDATAATTPQNLHT